MTRPLQHTALICLVILLGFFTIGPAAAAPPASLKDKVELTAWLEVEGGRTANVIVEVTVNGTKDWGRPDADGRVELVLPADAVAQISFRKPGLQTKTVSVDTHHMQEGRYKRRNLNFGVILDADSGQEGPAIAARIGAIAFAPGGALLVENAQQLEHEQKVVF